MNEILLSLIDDPIVRFCVILAAVIGVALEVARRVRKRLDQLADTLGIVKHEVKNNHSTNLREEADDRHYENRDKLDRLDGKIDTVLELVVNHGKAIERIIQTADNQGTSIVALQKYRDDRRANEGDQS